MKTLREDGEEVIDNPLSGWSSTSYTDKNLTSVDLLNSNHNVHVKMIVQIFKLQIATEYTITTNDLNMRN